MTKVLVDGYPAGFDDHGPRCLFPRKVFTPSEISYGLGLLI